MGYGRPCLGAKENIETVKAIYEAFGKGDVPTILGLLTDDVDWAADAEGDFAPWYGHRVGKEAVSEFFQAIGGAFDVEEFTPVGLGASDTEAMAFIRFRVKSKDGAREARMNIHHYWRFRDGLVEYYRGSEDTAQMKVALGA